MVLFQALGLGYRIGGAGIMVVAIGSAWIPVSKTDPRLVSLYERHYSANPRVSGRARRQYGISGPNESLALLTVSCDAGFIWIFNTTERYDKQTGVSIAHRRKERIMLETCSLCGSGDLEKHTEIICLATRLTAKDAEIGELHTTISKMKAGEFALSMKLSDAQEQTAALRLCIRELEADRDRWRGSFYNAQPSSEQIGQLEAKIETLEAKVAAGDRLAEVLAFVNPHANKLHSPCFRCGQHPVPFDWRLEDDALWQRVVPKEWQADVVCLPCFDALAAEKGETDYYRHVVVVYFSGQHQTVPFIPAHAYEAAQGS